MNNYYNPLGSKNLSTIIFILSYPLPNPIKLAKIINQMYMVAQNEQKY